MPTLRSHTSPRSSLSSPRVRSSEFGRATDDNPETLIGQRILPQPNGCWLYKGNADQYGLVTVRGKTTSTHRYVYQVLVGPVPEGHHLHHECETKGCCNPAHLVALDPSEHGRRHAEMRHAG